MGLLNSDFPVVYWMWGAFLSTSAGTTVWEALVLWMGWAKKWQTAGDFPVRFLKIEHHSSSRALITFQRWFENCPVIATCCYSVARSCPTLCDPMDCSIPGFPVLRHLPELKFISMELVMPSNHLVLWNSSAGISFIATWLWSYSLTCWFTHLELQVQPLHDSDDEWHYSDVL